MSDKDVLSLSVYIDGMRELSEKARELAETAEKACRLASEMKDIELEARIHSSLS